MLNGDYSKDDDARLQRIVQRLTRHQTDVRRLWGRMGQVPDSMGLPLAGQQTVSIPYTPAAAPTTTTAPTTSTTTTPAPATAYLYPVWDRDGGTDWLCSTGTEMHALVDDRGDDWPDHDDYIHLPENRSSILKFWIEPLLLFSAVQSVEIELYCKNEILVPLLTFTAQVFGDDEVTALTDAVPITGVGYDESSFSLRSASFTPTVDAQDPWNWGRPTLQLNVETDNDAGSPDFFLSAVRVKVTYIPVY